MTVLFIKSLSCIRSCAFLHPNKTEDIKHIIIMDTVCLINEYDYSNVFFRNKKKSQNGTKWFSFIGNTFPSLLIWLSRKNTVLPIILRSLRLVSNLRQPEKPIVARQRIIKMARDLCHIVDRTFYGMSNSPIYSVPSINVKVIRYEPDTSLNGITCAP